jgi:hypothetical protein
MHLLENNVLIMYLSIINIKHEALFHAFRVIFHPG